MSDCHFALVDIKPRRLDYARQIAERILAKGFHPVPYGDLPPHLAAINRAQIAVQELAVRVVQERDPERVFQAMTLDPLTAMSCTLDQIREMTIELLEAHRALGLLSALDGKKLNPRAIMFDRKSDNPGLHVNPGSVS